MQSFNNWAQTNPYAVFIIMAAGFAASLVQLWPMFGKAISKKITIPLGFVQLGVLAVISLVAYITLKPTPGERTKIVGKAFGTEQVIVDGKFFERCKFDGSELIFNGEAGFSLTECWLSTTAKLTLGERARPTLEVLRDQYRSQTFRPLVETIMTDIKNGRLRKSYLFYVQ